MIYIYALTILFFIGIVSLYFYRKKMKQKFLRQESLKQNFLGTWAYCYPHKHKHICKYFLVISKDTVRAYKLKSKNKQKGLAEFNNGELLRQHRSAYHKYTSHWSLQGESLCLETPLMKLEKGIIVEGKLVMKGSYIIERDVSELGPNDLEEMENLEEQGKGEIEYDIVNGVIVDAWFEPDYDEDSDNPYDPNEPYTVSQNIEKERVFFKVSSTNYIE